MSPTTTTLFYLDRREDRLLVRYGARAIFAAGVSLIFATARDFATASNCSRLRSNAL